MTNTFSSNKISKDTQVENYQQPDLRADVDKKFKAQNRIEIKKNHANVGTF